MIELHGSMTEIAAQPSLLELGLRFGVVALGIFLAIQMLRSKLPSFMMVTGAVFDIAIGAFALISSPWIVQQLGAFYIPLHYLAVLAPAIFWLYALALFDDRFSAKPVYFLPVLILFLLHSAKFLSPPATAQTLLLICSSIDLILFLSVPFFALRHLRSDLVETRRYFRVACGTIIPLLGIYFSSKHLFETINGPPSAYWFLLDAIILFAITLQFSLWLTQCENEIIEIQQARGVAAQKKAVNAVDALELDHLQKLINEGVCFEEGLTIGGLAEKLDMPEHRLRVLINKGLGYRNFPAFLNDHRIEVAKKWLSDPSRGREQIIQIAYGLGYASLAPFNRAFRERVGVSPSQFRSEAF